MLFSLEAPAAAAAAVAVLRARSSLRCTGLRVSSALSWESARARRSLTSSRSILCSSPSRFSWSTWVRAVSKESEIYTYNFKFITDEVRKTIIRLQLRDEIYRATYCSISGYCHEHATAVLHHDQHKHILYRTCTKARSTSSRLSILCCRASAMSWLSITVMSPGSTISISTLSNKKRKKGIRESHQSGQMKQ